MTKIDTCLSTRVSKWHAWLHLVHVQTQKPHVSFLSLLFPVWQPCSSEGRRVAPHQYLPCSLILLLSISGRLVGWAYVLQSSSSCTFCRAIRQVRKLPLLKHYSTGGKRDNWWQRITKALRSPLPPLQEGVWYRVAQECSTQCLHPALLLVKHHLLACCVFLRLKCAQHFLHNLPWVVPSTNIELQSLLIGPGILATSHTCWSKTY